MSLYMHHFAYTPEIRNGLIALVISAVLAGSASAQSDLVKRGDYLVNGILTCGNCHTPKGPLGDIMDKAFSGGASWDEPAFKVTASNITQDKKPASAITPMPSSSNCCARASSATAYQSPWSCLAASMRL